MATTDLLFEAGAAPSPDLVFGADYTPPAIAFAFDAALPPPAFKSLLLRVVTMEAAGALPAPAFTAQVLPVVKVALVTGATLPGLAMVAEAAYASNTARPKVGQAQVPWQETHAVPLGVGHGQDDTMAAPTVWAPRWQGAAIQPAGVAHPLPQTMDHTRHDRHSPFQDGMTFHLQCDFMHQEAAAAWVAHHGPFRDGARDRRDTLFLHQDADRTKRGHRAAWHQVASAHRRSFTSSFQPATARLRGWGSRYQDAVSPPAGVSVHPIPPALVPAGPSGPQHLLFEFPSGFGGTSLVFGLPSYDPSSAVETVAIPVQKVYLVINNALLRRFSDGALVPALTLSLSLDAGSWTWGFSASLPASAQALVEPGNQPVELEAVVNGTSFRVLAESVTRERVFGQVGIRVAGRGRNAVLDAPYAPVKVFSNPDGRTAQQLMNDVLTDNGIALGYSIEWGLTDWNVPAGVFSHQGTYISALAAIAKAAGGYLVPHPSVQAFRVKHRYPVAPWQWGGVVPDWELPSAVMTQESLEWKKKADYNRIFVSGQQTGVLGQVTRAGTAGDVLAPMVVDALITEAAAARQRGLAELGDTGRQIEVSLRLPVLADTGIVQPGAFIRYQDEGASRLGIVRSTQVEAGLPEVWQTLGVEVHA